RLPGVVGAPTPARLARTARPGRAVAKGPNRPGSAPLVLHAEAHQPAAFRGGFIVAGAGAVDDQRADILTVGDVVQPGEGFDGHVAKGMAITAPPVHNGVTGRLVLVVVGGVALAHALGFEGGMETAAHRLPGQLGVEAVTRHPWQAVAGMAGAVALAVAVIFGVQPGIGQITRDAVIELLLDAQ